MKNPINYTSSKGGLNRIIKYCNREGINNYGFDVYNNNTLNEYNNLDTPVKTFHILETLDEELNFEFENNNIKSSLYKSSFKTTQYVPKQIKKAYNVPIIKNLLNIRRVTIAIITAYHNHYLKTDMDYFSSRFNLPKCNLQVYNLGRNTFNSNWAIESTLDVQWSFAINPNSKIILVEARSNNFNDMSAAIIFANKLNPDIVTMSWGQHDLGNNPSWTNICNNKKTCYLAASGDSNILAFPSVTPNVMSIGGTSLLLDDNNEILLEKPWALSGSGFSKSFSKPNYQPILSSNNSNKRMGPDICSVGDPKTGVLIVANKKPYRIGGTSVSAPIIAGIISLAIQHRLNNKKSPLTTIPNLSNSIQPLLYNQSIYNDCFNDIITGSSGTNTATKGFDLATGLGSIKCDSLINNLFNI